MDQPPSPKSDLLTAVILLLVSAIGASVVLSDPNILGADYGSDPGPGLLPAILLALLALFSLVLGGSAVVRMVRARRTAKPDSDRWRSLGVPALLVATLVGYSQAMEGLGFIVTTGLFAMLWTTLIGIQDGGGAGEDGGGAGARRLALYLVEGALITAGIYAVFAGLIKVPLP